MHEHRSPRGQSRRALRVAALTAAVFGLTATSAMAATFTGNLGSYTYSGDAVANNLTVTDNGASVVFQDTQPLTETSDCAQTNATTVTCTVVTNFTANLLAGDDQTTYNGVDFIVTQSGGDGNDTLRGTDSFSGVSSNGDAGNDTLFPGRGFGSDLNGGDGNDRFVAPAAGQDYSAIGGPGADTFEAGPGFERVDYSDMNGVNVSLNGAADDADGDNVGNVDQVFGSPGNDTLTGNDEANGLFGQGGDDTVNGGGGDDSDFSGAGGLSGGDGNDIINGDAGSDSLSGGSGNDTLNGGDGDDALDGDEGADAYNGGAGTDSASLSRFVCGPSGCTSPDMSATLDGQANDGAAGEGDNVGADVEDVDTGSGNDSLVGNAEFNILSSGAGNDTVDGGGGSDLINSGAGDDTINARDGFADRVSCGPGADTANVDQLDTVAADCETVNRSTVAVALEDRPPTVAFETPGAGAKIGSNTPTMLRATAKDDRGVASVLFLDDDRVVCTDTAAPYECNYQPRGEDVNRNTLAVVAVDTTEQSAFAGRTVLVPRFRATRLTSSVKPGRDQGSPYRFTTSGRLRLPAAVTRTLGCSGTVTVQFKAGKKTVSTRRAKLSKSCTYRSRVTFRIPSRLRPKALRVVARFSGNAIVLRKSATRRSVRVR